MSSQTLSFWTTGEGFTNLLTQFFEEGQFKKVYETLEDGGLPLDQIKEFFFGRGYFIGDTRGDGTLTYGVKEKAEKPQEERFYWAMRNFLTVEKNKQTHHVPEYNDGETIHEAFDYDSHYRYESLLDALKSKAWEESENLQCLQKVITRQELIDLIWKKVLKTEGYNVNPTPKNTNGNGVILRTGDLVECSYMDHVNLYPILAVLGLASSSDWTEDEWTIHVSSSSLTGKAMHSLDDAECELTDKQIDALIKYRKVFRKGYGSRRNTMETLRDGINEKENYGGKYNNLCFLKRVYKKINLPNFSKEPIPKIKNCLRTSPKYSLPGLLESKFEINDNSINEMQQTFERFKDVRPENEFHYFYQEFIPGINGVCHRTRHGFSYAIGDVQGDVVQGKASKKLLSTESKDALQKIVDDIYDDLNESIQIEFVIDENNKVYIVQLRKLQNEAENTVRSAPPPTYLFRGRTFCKGTLEGLTKDDVLVVDKDAKSEELLGKKALIVKSNVEFSHILALSQALNIPSIYATGEFDLPETFNIKAYNEDAYIY